MTSGAFVAGESLPAAPSTQPAKRITSTPPPVSRTNPITPHLPIATEPIRQENPPIEEASTQQTARSAGFANPADNPAAVFGGGSRRRGFGGGGGSAIGQPTFAEQASQEAMFRQANLARARQEIEILLLSLPKTSAPPELAVVCRLGVMSSCDGVDDALAKLIQERWSSLRARYPFIESIDIRQLNQGWMLVDFRLYP